MLTSPLLIPTLIVGAVLLGTVGSTIIGAIRISEKQLGVVIKRFGKPLPPGRLIAINNEAGYQADTLAPGWHFGYIPFLYTVKKIPVTVIPAGQIGLLVASDGVTMPSERILGKVVDCKNFQDARQFLVNGGEKGQQLGILRAGTHRINTALFTVITAQNADMYELKPQDLFVYQVKPDKVGIVTTLDGAPIDDGEIAGHIVDGHENFQNSQVFIDKHGRRGLQEQVLLSGSWNLNPWFVTVEQVDMTRIPIGHVGIVISYVGKQHVDVSGEAFKHGNLVDPGHKGVWVTPLYPGKHPLNTRVMRIELVPTTDIVLNWASRTETHSYDAQLDPIVVRSKDGFAFRLNVSQIIHIGAPEAPKVISRVGSVQNLVDHVLQPFVGNYFRNSAQEYTVLDFLKARSERQSEAAAHIKQAISLYDVQAIDTLIGEITPPDELMKTQTDRKIAEEEEKTYEVQRMAQTQRQLLVRETSLADIQKQMVGSEQGVMIAELNSQAEIKRAEGQAESKRLLAAGEADAIRATGEAKAAAYQSGVNALGAEAYVALQMMQVIGDKEVRIVPDVAVSGHNEGNGMVDGLLGMMLKQNKSMH